MVSLTEANNLNESVDEGISSFLFDAARGSTKNLDVMNKSTYNPKAPDVTPSE
jgi:hypothetical protein